eukprot:TRINITY_DN15174_c1_g3_i1.p1 TRINITY_DN15174_c1_g3~~TRINITY_DN15174_c1_g3_i1.p1  ORF type:complete len:607 (+),score=172.48 TRINITY_DN15174_c1_g3_i1:153-1973(+)
MADPAKPSVLQRLGQCCSGLCGSVARRRRAARDVERARARCAELKMAAGEGGEYVPVEHLRAAEQHLALIERWLLSNRLYALRSNNSPAWQAERLAQDLGVARSSETEEAQAEFLRRFEPPPEEIFVTAVSCSALSRNFRYPGKIYISCLRFSFDSCILGLSVSFAVRWEDVRFLRFEPCSKSTTFPVRVHMRTPVSFDGKELKTFELRVFDINGLKILHKSAMYFLGTGLFGMWQGGEEPEPTEEALEEARTRLQTGFREESAASSALQEAVSIWELERRTTIFNDWGPPSLITDGVRRMRWCALDSSGAFVKHPLAPENVSYEKFAASDVPPLEHVEFLGQQRDCQWALEPREGETDELGWQYSTGFDLHLGWVPECSNMHVVRRRCWLPRFSQADGDMPIQRVPTTYIDLKKLGVGGSTPQVVFEGDAGEFSLAAFGEALDSDDPWEADASGGFMARYFAMIEARDMEVGAWAEGGACGSVKGKARSIEYRKPLPPKPMCPKESRMQSTCHIVVSEEKVTLEQSVMTLDVPAGTAWQLWVCDTFTNSGGGRVKLRRTCACEWLQSSWLKSMIEREAPGACGEEAATMLKAIAAWKAAGKREGL